MKGHDGVDPLDYRCVLSKLLQGGVALLLLVEIKVLSLAVVIHEFVLLF